MAKFKIPATYKKGFEDYLNLADSIKVEFYNLIKDAPVGYKHNDLAIYLEGKIKIDTDSLREICKAIYSVFELKAEKEIANTELVKGLIEALTLDKFNVSANLHGFFNDLLSIKESINLTIKATYLATDRQNILLDTRIITDVRPVFGVDEESEELKATLITHNLKIQYEEDDQIKYIYFALDANDLSVLKDHIVRAENKELKLRTEYAHSSKVIDLK